MNRFHPQTEKLIENLRTAPWHAVLLSGPRGIGLQHISDAIHSGTAIIIRPDDTKASPVISVETIRTLYEQTRGKSSSDQYIVIQDADTMTGAAQTAFLKLLEEPGDTIRFILTSHRHEHLLPTVRSRLQHYTVQPLSPEQSDDFMTFLGVKDLKTRTQLRFIAEGLPDELEKLVNDKEYFEANTKLVTDAKLLLAGKVYNKLLLVNSYREDRSAALQLIEAATNIIRKSLSLRPSHELVEQLENLLMAETRLRSNGSVRLVLARLVLQ